MSEYKITLDVDQYILIKNVLRQAIYTNEKILKKMDDDSCCRIFKQENEECKKLIKYLEDMPF